MILCEFLPSETHPMQRYFPGEALAPITLEDIRNAAPPLRPGQRGWMVRWGHVWSDLPDVHVHVSGRESPPHPLHGSTATERIWSYIPIVGAGYTPSAPYQIKPAQGDWPERQGWPAPAYSVHRLRERPPEPTYGEPRASHAGREWEESESGAPMAQQMHWSVCQGQGAWVDGYGNWPFSVVDYGYIELHPAARMAV